VNLERFADGRGLRPDGLTRAKDLLHRAAEMDPATLPLEDQDAAYCAYLNCLGLLATVGERPLEATERLKVAYSQVRKVRYATRQDRHGVTTKLGGVHAAGVSPTYAPHIY
jgi:hypothetical protein